MQFYIANATESDPLLSQAVKWFQLERLPRRENVPEGVLTKLLDKMIRRELTVLHHPSGDPDLPVCLMVKDGGKNKLVLPEAVSGKILMRAHAAVGHGGVEKHVP